MRPQALTLTAFGPFASTERIDFGALDEHGLLLIHGCTGAGKTTLLDAMTFALYGATSGGERTGREMRSQHAHPTVPTEVTFEFDVRGRRFRVRRAPEQERPRHRGKVGVTTAKTQVALEARASDLTLDDSAQGAVGLDGFVCLATKSTEVEAHIERLLGLTADQFRQVVLLPQGGFREFLIASSRERQQILESLFGTERFRRLEEALREEASCLKARIVAERERSQQLLSVAGASAPDNLERERDDLELQRTALRADIQALTQDLADARAALETARADDERRVELRAAIALRSEVEANATSHDGDKNRLARAQTAAKIAPVVERADEATRADAKGKQRAIAARAELDAAWKAEAAAQATLSRERSRDDERERQAAEVRSLEALRGRVGEVQEAQGMLESAGRALAEAQHQRSERANASERSAAELTGCERRLDETRVRAARFESHRARYLQLLERARRKRDLDDVLARHEAAAAALAATSPVEASAAEACAAAEAARDAAEAAWTRGQAAALARLLTDDEACPVCGSHEHPRPADGDDAPLSQGIVTRRRNELERARQVLEQARADVTRRGAEVDRLAAERDFLAKQLGDNGAEAGDLDAAESAMAEAEAAHEALADLDENRTKMRATVAADVAALLQAERRLEEATRTCERAKAILDERSASLPPELRGADALSARLATATATLASLQAELESAILLLGDAERARIARAAAFEQAQREADERAQGAAEHLSRLHDALREADLDDRAAFDTARLAPDELARLDGSVRVWEQRAHTAHEREKRAAAAVGDGAALDVEAARRRVAHLEGQLGDANQAAGQMRARAEQLAQLSQELSAADAERATHEARYQVIGRLAEVASGDNPEGLTFQRWVLSTLLDDVLEAASGHLQRMSRSRYRLLRAKEATHRRRARGLELIVADAHTGLERRACTLSGGESFLAALSLALGLADTVQARAGGAGLEAIFIDEGFGGLDPEALDLAIDALSALRSGGRCVTLISHVDELKERIGGGIEVKRAKAGSTLAGLGSTRRRHHITERLAAIVSTSVSRAPARGNG